MTDAETSAVLYRHLRETRPDESPRELWRVAHRWPRAHRRLAPVKEWLAGRLPAPKPVSDSRPG